MSYDKYMKMSKPALIRKITKALRAMPKAKLARLCYNITKSKLPRLKRRTRSGFPAIETTITDIIPRRKFSRKQLAAQRLFAKRARAGTLRKRRR